MRVKHLIMGALGAIVLAGCQTAPTVSSEVVTMQYDPKNYDQTRTTSDAVKQCRAKGYATAVPDRQQPTMRRSRWGYQNFLCVS